MSEKTSELDDLDDTSSINVELESIDILSNVSSSYSQALELGQETEISKPKNNIIQQLFLREVGTVHHNLLRKSIPTKTYSLKRLFPPHVLQGQIFMGLTRCGQFAITYSNYLLPTEEEWYGCAYSYRLHWWTVPPDGQSKEVASVALFGNAKISAPLHLLICQWPICNKKVLVYGLLKENAGLAGLEANQRAFVTVTAIPTLNACGSCTAARSACSLGDNAGVLTEVRCLDHGLTVHTSFDIAVPYPEFQPRINLKYEDIAIFNTNNALHAWRVSLDSSTSPLDSQLKFPEHTKTLSVQVPLSPCPLQTSSHLQEQILRDFADEASLTPLKEELDCLSPPMPTRVKTFTDCLEIPHPSRVEFLKPQPPWRLKKQYGKRLGIQSFFSGRRTMGSLLEPNTRKNSPYEFVDDSGSELEELSQFRRKRLADKTYEFQECDDAENIVPFSVVRQGPFRNPTQPQVLRPVNHIRLLRKRCRTKNVNHSLDSPTFPKQPWMAEGEVLVHDLSGLYRPALYPGTSHLSDRLRRLGHCFRGSAFTMSRKFAETDIERVTEDDDTIPITGYHTLLNVEVQCGGQSQLHVSSNGEGSVRVDQQSLDIEAICQSVATSLCLAADKTFTFCNDYDVEVLDVCPRTGEVLVLLMMRIEGCEGRKEDGAPIQQFETSATLLWNLVQADYRIIMVSPPQKLDWDWDEKTQWNPAREAARRFRANLPPDVSSMQPSVRIHTNCSYLRGVSLERIEDCDNNVQFVL